MDSKTFSWSIAQRLIANYSSRKHAFLHFHSFFSLKIDEKKLAESQVICPITRWKKQKSEKDANYALAKNCKARQAINVCNVAFICAMLMVETAFSSS